MRDLGAVTVSMDSKNVIITLALWSLLPCSVLSNPIHCSRPDSHGHLEDDLFDGARCHEWRGQGEAAWVDVCVVVGGV